MIRRAALLFTLLGAGCGPAESPLQLNIVLSAAAPVASDYDIRVFGAKVTCGKVLAAPETFLTTAICTGATADTNEDCHIARATGKPGEKSRFDLITPGQRAIFVVGVDASKIKVSKGCTTVNVTAGAATTATLNVSAY